MAFSIMGVLRPVVTTSIKGLDLLAPLFDLGIRLWIARIFWNSGYTKIQSWQTTLELFEWEYQVPVFPPELAAYMATAAELSMPVLLAIGLASRPAALVLLFVNYMAAISYPDISIGGTKDHILWGVMLLITLFHGPGKLSVDYLIQRRVGR